MNIKRPTLRAVSAAILTVMMLAVNGLTAMAATIPAVVKVNTYVYKSANTASRRAKVKKGTAVTVVAYNSKWAKITASGITAYIPRNKLKATALPDVPDVVEEDEDAGQSDAQDDGVLVDPSDGGSGGGNDSNSGIIENGYLVLQPGDKGDDVKKLQTRLKELNWFYGDIGGNYLTQTEAAVREFQNAGKLSVTGIASGATQKLLFSSGAPKLDFSDISTAQPASGRVQNADWWTSGISSKFARGSYATVTDVLTGISFRVYRGGGTNHADVQPATAADTAAMKKCYSGTWSWNRRAVWVSVGGVRYAASMNGMPHGGGSVQNNNFNGHFCIHFTNSRTHGTNKVCPQHQAAIQAALNAG